MSIIEEVQRAQAIAKPERVAATVYVEAAKFLAGILFEAALFGASKQKTKAAIADIYDHIGKLYKAVEELAKRQDAIRLELINLIEEVEYRDIAYAIYGVSDVMKLLSSKDDSSITSAAFLQLSINQKRLHERLDASYDVAYGVRYQSYLDLLLTNTGLYVIAASTMPDLDVDQKADVIETSKEALREYIQYIRVHIRHSQSLRFEAVTGPDGLDCSHDDDGSTISCRQDWGFMMDKKYPETYKKVTKITLYPGGPAAIAANEEKRKKALELVKGEIAKEVDLLTEQIWNDGYGSIQI